MATDSLIFPCPACGIKLSVPLSIAGISGPCPSCWKQIQSPRANVPPSAASLAPAARKSQDAEPPHEPDDFPAPKPDPACTQLPESADSAVPGGSRPVARPLPKRTVPEEIVIDEPENRIGCMWNALPTPLPRPSRKTMKWLRFLLAAIGVSGAAALAYFAAQ